MPEIRPVRTVRKGKLRYQKRASVTASHTNKAVRNSDPQSVTFTASITIDRPLFRLFRFRAHAKSPKFCDESGHEKAASVTAAKCAYLQSVFFYFFHRI